MRLARHYGGVVTSSDGTVIGFESHGVGPNVLFIHGGVSDREAWRAVAAGLDHYTHHLLDRRGRGLSADEASSYCFEREYEDIASVISSLDGPVHVAGHSSGAICAMGAAMKAEVASLVLYEPPIPVLRPLSREAIDNMERAIAKGRRAEAVRDGLIGIAEVPEPVADAMAQDPKRLALIDTWARECREINRLSADASAYAAINVPTALLVGTTTSEYQRAGVDALAATMPHAEVIELPGQGHGALATAPTMVTDAVRSFLARVG